MLRFILVTAFLAVTFQLITGCTDNSEPSTTSETSAARPLLSDRIQFLEQYVKFRRNYKQLEYDVFFHNGGSFPAGPSEWDIRIVALVDSSDLDQWMIAGKRDRDMETPDWVKRTAGELDVGLISEWYVDGGRIVGIDRHNHIIAYRNFAR